MSRRVGQLKQMLDWSGRSILCHVAGTLLDAGLQPVIVVLGHQRDRLAAELRGVDVHIVENPDYETGMFGSARCGLAALPKDVMRCVVALVDLPGVDCDVVRRVVGAHQDRDAAVTIPRHAGRTGHPVVLGRDVIDVALAAAPSVTLRDVLARFADRTVYVDVDTDSVVRDIDTLHDYEQQRPR